MEPDPALACQVHRDEFANSLDSLTTHTTCNKSVNVMHTIRLIGYIDPHLIFPNMEEVSDIQQAHEICSALPLSKRKRLREPVLTDINLLED
jgi:hypothetical protein